MNGRSPICQLHWSYGSDKKVAYLTMISPSGKALTLRRDQFRRLPREFLERVGTLIKRVYIDPSTNLETFKGQLYGPFPVADMQAFKQAAEETRA